jgi:hypothetical protein
VVIDPPEQEQKIDRRQEPYFSIIASSVFDLLEEVGASLDTITLEVRENDCCNSHNTDTQVEMLARLNHWLF